MNTPYVKQYDKKGILTNPIIGKLTHDFDNRKTRREVKQKTRFFGNGKSLPLTVTKGEKYLRRIQLIGKKRIEHYFLLK